MTTFHKPNLPREAMPWARDIERALEEFRRGQEAVKSGSLASSRAASSANLTAQTIQATVNEVTEVALPELNTAVEEAVVKAEEAIDKSIPAAVLRIDSSKGSVFKNNAISTVLNVTIYYAGAVIVDLFTLRDMIGPGAYLEWFWRREEDTEFSVISAGDSRLSNAGFSLTVSPDDVDEKTVFQCILHD